MLPKVPLVYVWQLLSVHILGLIFSTSSFIFCRLYSPFPRHRWIPKAAFLLLWLHFLSLCSTLQFPSRPSMPDLGHGVGGDGDGDREVAMTASQGHGWSVGEWVNLGVDWFVQQMK
ncbi:hypothetical protein V6000_002337 [Aspergillus fumigatus]